MPRNTVGLNYRYWRHVRVKVLLYNQDLKSRREWRSGERGEGKAGVLN